MLLSCHNYSVRIITYHDCLGGGGVREARVVGGWVCILTFLRNIILFDDTPSTDLCTGNLSLPSLSQIVSKLFTFVDQCNNWLTGTECQSSTHHSGCHLIIWFLVFVWFANNWLVCGKINGQHRDVYVEMFPFYSNSFHFITLSPINWQLGVIDAYIPILFTSNIQSVVILRGSQVSSLSLDWSQRSKVIDWSTLWTKTWIKFDFYCWPGKRTRCLVAFGW